MDLSVRKSDLLRELQLFQGIIERKNTIPILANILFKANGNGSVRLLATDYEVGLRSQFTASITKPGSLTVPAKKLYEIVRALPDTDIRIRQGAKDTEGNSTVMVSADQFNSNMQTPPLEDFPSVPEMDDAAQVDLPRELLRTMVARTMFAITAEDQRYHLNGALFVVKSDAMSLIATDGHRLALATAAREGVEVEDAILPKKMLWELARLLSEGEGEYVQYGCDDKHLLFKIDGRLLSSRKIELKFPAYERVIPSGNNKKIEFDCDRLTNAIKRVELLANEQSRAVTIQISPNTVKVTSSGSKVGSAEEKLGVDYSGEDLQVCFQAKYVLDFLNAIDTESATLELKDANSQAVMHPAGAEANYTYVLMPMRTNQ